MFCVCLCVYVCIWTTDPELVSYIIIYYVWFKAVIIGYVIAFMVYEKATPLFCDLQIMFVYWLLGFVTFKTWVTTKEIWETLLCCTVDVGGIVVNPQTSAVTACDPHQCEPGEREQPDPDRSAARRDSTQRGTLLSSWWGDSRHSLRQGWGMGGGCLPCVLPPTTPPPPHLHNCGRHK